MARMQIRCGVFETNSSSTHSICITKDKYTGALPETIDFALDDDFGWSFEIYTGVQKKANYLYQAINSVYDGGDKIAVLNGLISILGKHGITCSYTSDDNGYIDHAGETLDFVKAIMHNEARLLRYLFGNSFIVTGNDNEEEHDDYMDSIDLSNYDVYEKGN